MLKFQHCMDSCLSSKFIIDVLTDHRFPNSYQVVSVNQVIGLLQARELDFVCLLIAPDM